MDEINTFGEVHDRPGKARKPRVSKQCRACCNRTLDPYVDTWGACRYHLIPYGSPGHIRTAPWGRCPQYNVPPPPPLKHYKIIDESGVDFNFLSAFGVSRRSWVGQVVSGNVADYLYPGAIVVNKPFGISGVWITDSGLQETDEPLTQWEEETCQTTQTT
jgi:hypothetical protein